MAAAGDRDARVVGGADCPHAPRRPAALPRRRGGPDAGRPQPRTPRPVPSGRQGVRRRAGQAGRRRADRVGHRLALCRHSPRHRAGAQPRDASRIVEALTGTAVGPALAPELVVLPTDDGGVRPHLPPARPHGGRPRRLLRRRRHRRHRARYSDLQTTIGTGQGVHNDAKKVSTTSRNGTYLAIDVMRPPAIYTYDLKGNLARTQAYLNGLLTLNDSDVAARRRQRVGRHRGRRRARLRRVDLRLPLQAVQPEGARQPRPHDDEHRAPRAA
ncbi:MAG: hypothetical protein M0C28_18100 [Candidatus Moduliflexus flocculans]|nr:hypothetical protein [Candidatus Moduliflexus flocculans]